MPDKWLVEIGGRIRLIHKGWAEVFEAGSLEAGEPALIAIGEDGTVTPICSEKVSGKMFHLDKGDQEMLVLDMLGALAKALASESPVIHVFSLVEQAMASLKRFHAGQKALDAQVEADMDRFFRVWPDGTVQRAVDPVPVGAPADCRIVEATCEEEALFLFRLRSEKAVNL